MTSAQREGNTTEPCRALKVNLLGCLCGEANGSLLVATKFISPLLYQFACVCEDLPPKIPKSRKIATDSEFRRESTAQAEDLPKPILGIGSTQHENHFSRRAQSYSLTSNIAGYGMPLLCLNCNCLCSSAGAHEEIRWHGPALDDVLVNIILNICHRLEPQLRIDMSPHG